MCTNEFQRYVDDLLRDEELIDRISNYPSHRLKDHTTKSGNGRLDHCLRVSFMCYKFAKILRLNQRRCTRAGLLHDSGYGASEPPWKQVLRHSIYSAEIARSRNEWEVASIIESHMFPFGKVPSNFEAVVLWFMDKVDAILDFFHITLSSNLLHC